MLTNYLKIAFRNLRRYAGYTVINVVGLAAGLACALLILLYVRDEVSYDRFHENGDRIVRVTLEFPGFGAFARAPVGAGPYLAQNYPEVEAAVRLYGETTVLRRDNGLLSEDRFYYADPSVFDVFTLPLVAGDPATALQEPGAVVLTASTARRYFGGANPMGQTFETGDGTHFRVMGIARDVPSNTHLPFDFLASFASLGEVSGYSNQSFTYLLLNEKTTPASFKEKLDAFTDQGMGAVAEAIAFGVKGMRFDLQPLTDIHLYSDLAGEAEPTSDVRYLYIFSAIGLFILLIAAINYMNLSTARSARRAREVGVRKVLGAGRSQLVRQFLGESLLLSILAFVLALVLIELFLPVFNDLTGKALTSGVVYQPDVLSLFALVVLSVGLVAGSYPAFYLTRFKPVRVLKGTSVRQTGGVWVRRGLVTFQFAISVALMAGTAIVLLQLDYIQSKRLGYDAEQVITMSLKDRLKEQADAFKGELKKLPGVQQVSIASMPMGGMISTSELDENPVQVRYLSVDADYLETMGMTLVEGRNFDSDLATDTSAVIINETAARLFGAEDQVGQVIDPPRFHGKSERLIGIVSDFHVASLHEAIMPTVLSLGRSLASGIVRLDPASIAATLPQIEAVWKAFVTDHPFSYSFLDDMMAEQYQAEQRLAGLVSVFAVLAIGIACLGLFGLAAYTAEQRTKEIGIRKVLGATAPGLVMLLSKEFLRLVVVAVLVGAPIAYLLMQQWLEDFAYRVELSWSIFLVSGLAALFVALLTVSYQAFKAAYANPVKALKYE